MASRPYPHAHHSAHYASPIIREPSPASTVGSSHGNQFDDKTSVSDSEDVINDADFARKWAERIGINQMSDAELAANISPPLLNYQIPQDEKTVIFDHHDRVESLRLMIQLHEDDDVFEQRIIRGSRVGMDILPTSADIDTIISSMIATDLEHSIDNPPSEDILTEELTNPVARSAFIVGQDDPESIRPVFLFKNK